jgi:hypothetical protein
MVTVDGKEGNSSELQRLSEYIQKLNNRYPNVQVLVSPKPVSLYQHVRRAMDMVQSEFVYVSSNTI